MLLNIAQIVQSLKILLFNVGRHDRPEITSLVTTTYFDLDVYTRFLTSNVWLVAAE